MRLGAPRLGIATCLLGEHVRYDGGHKLDPYLTEVVGSHVEWVPVCPEMEIGLGAPRPPIHLRETEDGVRLTCPDTGEDLTQRMAAYAAGRIEALRAKTLHGYVLKARSPSCGVDDAALVDAAGIERGVRSGAFAEALATAWPELRITTEAQLARPAVSESFLQHVFALWRFDSVSDASMLRAFHRAHHWVIVSRAAHRLGALDEAAAAGNASVYRRELAAALGAQAAPEGHADALRAAITSITGTVPPDDITAAETAVEHFFDGRAALAEAVRLVGALRARIAPDGAARDAYLTAPPPIAAAYAQL